MKWYRPEKSLFSATDFYVIVVCILMTLEGEGLQFYDLKEIYHILVQTGFLAFAIYKQLSVPFEDWVKPVPFKDSC